MFFWGQGLSSKLVLIITLLKWHFLKPLHNTLRRNTIQQIPHFGIPISMDLFKFTFQMFSIRQQVTHSTEQEALRAQSSWNSHWLMAFTTTSQRRNADGGFPHSNLYILILVQFRREIEKQLEGALVETFVIIWNMSLLFKRLNCSAWSKVLKTTPEPWSNVS